MNSSAAVRHTRQCTRVTRRARLARVAGRVWMMLYLVLTAAMPLADAGVDHRTEVAAHWEDAEGPECPTPHGADTCEICQLLTGSRGLPSRAAPALAVIDGAKQPTPSTADAAPGRWVLDSQSSRAPPRA